MMFAFPPNIIASAKDRRLTGDDRAVLVLVTFAWLSDREYLPIKVAMLAREMYEDPVDPTIAVREWHHNNIGRTLRRLVTFGYLDRGKDVPAPGVHREARLRTYRLRQPPRRPLSAAPAKD